MRNVGGITLEIMPPACDEDGMCATILATGCAAYYMRLLARFRMSSKTVTSIRTDGT